MRAPLRIASAIAFAVATVGLYAACSSDEEAPPPAAPSPEAGAGYRGFEQAGQSCTAPSQCYLDPRGVDGGDGGVEAGTQLPVKGSIYCETKVENGYCTHECTADTDCCAVPGECRTAVKQVCSPFTNTANPKYCFLSCEDDDIRAAIAANVDAGGWDGGAPDGGTAFDPDAYCYHYASVYSTCRSSGGGKENRKVCIPKL